MRAFFVKDVLVAWRDRKELLISLIAPLAIIFVLGALPDWTKGTTEVPQAALAVVMEDNEEEGLRRFRERTAALPPEDADAAARLLPVSMLMETLRSGEIADYLTLREAASRAEAVKWLENGEVSAVLTFSAGYTEAVLNKMLLGDGGGMALSLTALEPATSQQLIQGIIEQFQRKANEQTAIGRAAAETGFDAGVSSAPGTYAEAPAVVGGRETAERFRSVTMHQYYTAAIAVLFPLFAAAAMASKSEAEKRNDVIHRILLTGRRPGGYLAGKIVSTMCLAALHMVFVFGVCHLILGLYRDRGAAFWSGFLLTLAVYCVFVACLAGFFTSLTLRMRPGAANGVMTMLITAIGTIGGNFVPLYILPDWMRSVGAYTPNGRALTAYLQWLQQESPSLLTGPLLQLLAYALLAVVAAVMLFPRRGKV